MSKIVVTGKIPNAGLEVLRQAGLDPQAWSQDVAMTREELLKQVQGAEILVTLLTEKVDSELLDAAGSQLKAVCNVAVGYNNIDVAACKARGVTVTNTPGVLTDATADIALALILMVTRRLAEGERVIRSKTPWQWGMHYMLGTGVTNRVLGVVGMGAIGIATARRAKACGMSVVYHSRSEIDSKIASELGAKKVSLDELLSGSDVVSIHCPSNESTHHLIGAPQFKKMKPTAFLVNTARGPIVDEQALVDALKAKEIAGAGLDVFEFEPKINEGLLDRDDVVLIPHLGSATTETRDAMAMLAANNAVAIASGKSPLTPVG
ncbi:MAG: D-glycerate dehydrogenase [Ilumatobacteraceae bacterium]|nr:D-glycerate dehydrogenase [Ilumatobacteraceae bacterium]MDP4901708.1 D-glycerate dehydrogenase [Ilumatobacteraceae bacterium]